MDYFRNIVVVAALAGAIAGLGMTIAQQLTTVPLILKAEVYEQAAERLAPRSRRCRRAAAPARMSMSDEGWAPADGFERTAFSAAANIVTGIGFALLLVAASELFGGIRDWRQGVFWGLAGFAVFTLAPGLGLPPELPAMPAAELGPRQLWWVATVLCDGDRARAAVLSAVLACGRCRHRAAGGAASDRRAAAGKLRIAHPRRPASQLRGRGGADHAAVLGAARRLGRAVPGTLRPRQLSHGTIVTPPGRGC